MFVRAVDRRDAHVNAGNHIGRVILNAFPKAVGAVHALTDPKIVALIGMPCVISYTIAIYWIFPARSNSTLIATRLCLNMNGLRIRSAMTCDLDAINAIYNHYVLNSTTTYQTEPETAEDRQTWLDARDSNHPVIVAESGSEILGWSSLSPFHPRAAYHRTVENSVYVRHDAMRRGLGSALLADLIERARALGHHTIIAGIDTEQTGSIAIHARFGFVEVAHLRQVGFKFNRWLGVVYMQLMLAGRSRKGTGSDPREPSPDEYTMP